MRIVWLLVLAACAGAASAQNLCPRADEVGQAEMLGRWTVQLEGAGRPFALVLEKHPEYTESLSGTLDRGGELRQVAGDMEEGEFTLEESADGIHIAGTWLGDVVEGSCGREIRGTWSSDGAGRGARSFVLRRE